MIDMRRARIRMKSIRSLVAIGGVAAMAFGIVQATGTLANPTDAVTSTGAQVATGNFYPTPLTSEVGCWTSGSVTGQRGNIWFRSVPGVTGYKVELVRKSNNTVKDTKIYTADEPRADWTGLSDSDRVGLYARVYTINGPRTSSGYTTGGSMSFKDWVSGRTACEGSAPPSRPNEQWENTNVWDPTTPAPIGNQLARGGGDVQAQRMATDADVTEEAKADETTTTEAPTSTTEAPTTTTDAPSPSTTERPSTTPPSTTGTPSTTTPATATTTMTEPPTTSTVSTTTARPAAQTLDLSGGFTAKLVDGMVTVLSDGTEQCSTNVAGAEKMTDNGDGTIAVTDINGDVHYVDTATCKTN